MKNYKTQSYKYSIILFVCLIPLISIMVFLIWLQGNIILGRTVRGGILDIIIGFLIELLILRIIYSFTVVFGSCLYNINFYNNKFEFRRLFRNKTVYYKEVNSLTEISPSTGIIQNREAKIRIIEIKLKNRKTMHILINLKANERERELKRDCEKYMKMSMELTYRFIFSIK